MIPFRVFDRENNTTWVVVNYHPSSDGGEYLVSREDDSEDDGQMALLSAKTLSLFRFLDFCEEHE
jgi:hypothetical protein